MTARPVSRAGFAKIDQLAENLRQRVVPAPLLRKTLGNFLQRRCVGYGVKFYYVFLCELSKSVHRSK